jgi:iron complex transport system permease protein
MRNDLMMTTQIEPIVHRPGHRTIRRGNLAVRVNMRVLGMTLIAACLLVVLMIWAMTLGSFSISFADVTRALLGHGTDKQELIVRDLRLPRVLCAVLIGASLSLAGLIFQGLVRNPLVSPDVIGINAGAGLLAVFAIVTGMSAAAMPVAAFVGAIIAAGAVYVLAWRQGIAPNRLILVGIGIGAMLQAATTYLTVRYPIEQARPALVWLMGSISGSDWGDVKVVAIFLAVCLPLTIALAWPLRAMQLGDDVARGLGIPLEPTRLLLILVGSALAAAAVAVAGPIGFVALMVPHFARMLAGPLSGCVALFTAVLGGAFLLIADIIGGHFLPVSIPVGVVTAAIGAPYFLLLLHRSNVRQ